MPDETPFTIERIAVGPRILLRVLFHGMPVGWAKEESEIDRLNTLYQSAQKAKAETRRRLNGHDRPGD